MNGCVIVQVDAETAIAEDAVLEDRIIGCGRTGDDNTLIGIARDDVRSAGGRTADDCVGNVVHINANVVGQTRRVRRVTANGVSLDGIVVGFDKHTVVRVARDHIACTGGCATQCVVNGPRLEVNAITLIAQARRSACIGANEVALDRVVRRGAK